MHLIINLTQYFKVIFVLAGTSHGGHNDYTYEELFNFLRRKGNLKPQNFTSRTILFDIIKTKYGGNKWDEAYNKIVKYKIL